MRTLRRSLTTLAAVVAQPRRPRIAPDEHPADDQEAESSAQEGEHRRNIVSKVHATASTYVCRGISMICAILNDAWRRP